PSVLRWLPAHEINEVHVEAGARLSGAMLEAGCIDELLVYMAPLLLGEGRGMAEVQAIARLDAAEGFEVMEALPVGTGMRLRLPHAGHWAELTQAVDRSAQRHLAHWFTFTRRSPCSQVSSRPSAALFRSSPWHKIARMRASGCRFRPRASCGATASWEIQSPFRAPA